jgi:hypothetical protein
MDLAAAYLAAEELISSIPTDTEAGRIKAISIYNAAAHLLDDAVGAWYKRVSISDRLVGVEKGRLSWERQFGLLMRVPWIVPIYAQSGGIDVHISRRLHTFSAPNHLLKEKGVGWNDPALMSGWRGGPPRKGLQCVGMAICMYTIALDEPRLDLMSSSSMRDVYGSARSSLLEMGAAHTRNIPYAGIIRASNMPICPIGMNRLGSDWNLNIQGAMYHSSPLQRWIGKPVYHRENGSVFFDLEPVIIAKWSNEYEAQMEVESIFFQVATMRTWNYLLESLDLKSDPLPKVFPVMPISSPYLEMQHVLPIVKRFATKNREANLNNGTIGFILHSLAKAITTKKIRLPKRVNGVIRAMRLFFVNSSIRNKTLADLVTIKTSAKYNPSRIGKLRRMTEAIKMLASLNDRKRILEKLRAELTFRDHFYWDKESGIRVFCEHELAALSNLAHGVSDPDAIVQKFSSGTTGASDLSVTRPTILECKYCGQDLGTIWLVNISSPEEIEYARQVEGTYLDTDIGAIVGRLLSNQSLQTKLLPSDITRIIDTVVSNPLGAEFNKIAKGGASDRPIKEQFLTLAATISVLHALEQSGAQLSLNLTSLDALLSKEYIDLLQKIGLLPRIAIQRMLDYWPKTLSRHLPNPQDTIRNAVIEVTGSKDDAVLGQLYQSALAFPVTMKVGQHLSDINIEKLKSASAKIYVTELRRTSPPEHLEFYRIQGFNKTAREPRIYTPKSVVPVIRSADIGKAKSEGSEESFAETVMNICPELLLHPMEGKQFYEAKEKMSDKDIVQPVALPSDSTDESKEEPAIKGSGRSNRSVRPIRPVRSNRSVRPIRPVRSTGSSENRSASGIYSTLVSLETHLFISKGEQSKVCKWCSIPSDHQYNKDYYAKYRKAVEDLEKKAITSFFECSMAKKGPSEAPGKVSVKLDSTLNKSLHQEFSRRFDWALGPDPSILLELSNIIAAIGYYQLSRLFSSELSEAVKVDKIDKKAGSHLSDIIITAWNVFMEWMLKQKDEVAHRTLNRFKAIRALKASVK